MSASARPWIRSRRLAWLLLAIPLFGLLLYVAAVPLRPDPESPSSYSFSFTDGALDKDSFQFSGIAPERYVSWEKKGMRITLPAEKGPAQPIGVALRHPVRGDFEFSALMQIFDLSSPRATLAIGVNVYVNVDSSGNDGLWLGKMLDPKQGAIFHTGVRGNVPDKGSQTKLETKVAAESLKGTARIRLVRKGEEFEMWVGDEAARKRIEAIDLGRGDVVMFRLAAEPGNRSDALVDIRQIELSVRAQEFVDYVPKAKRGKGP